MWPFTRSPKLATNAEVIESLVALKRRYDDLENDLAALRRHHLSLRGYTYAKLGKSAPEAPDSSLSDLSPKDRLRVVARQRGLLSAKAHPTNDTIEEQHE